MVPTSARPPITPKVNVENEDAATADHGSKESDVGPDPAKEREAKERHEGGCPNRVGDRPPYSEASELVRPCAEHLVETVAHAHGAASCLLGALQVNTRCTLVRSSRSLEHLTRILPGRGASRHRLGSYRSPASRRAPARCSGVACDVRHYYGLHGPVRGSLATALASARRGIDDGPRGRDSSRAGRLLQGACRRVRPMVQSGGPLRPR